jgi:hypothetical protein
MAHCLSVLSWTELVTMIGRHPKLLHLNVYVTMFYKVNTEQSEDFKPYLY